MSRFIGLLLLFLLSLLTIFKAPAYPFWIAAIFVAEYGWLFFLFTLLLIISGIWIQKFKVLGTVFGILAMLLFISPVIRAAIIAKTLGAEMNASFQNSGNVSEKAFSIKALFNSDAKTTYHTFTYTKNSDTSLTLDYYQSSIQGKRPCVIVIHGGSWSGGDSQQLPELNSVLAKAGYRVASINYRLSPKYRYPSPLEDTRLAIRYLKRHCEELAIDTNQLVLLGRSAGGQIALMAAYQSPDTGIKGIIDFYGPADMVWGYSAPANPLVFDSNKIMERYLGGTYAQVPQQYRNSSPLEFVNAHTVPTLIIHGENDVLVAYEHSQRLNAKLQQYGIKHYFLTLPWATHGFDYNLRGPGGQLSTYAVLRFLEAVTH
ncbi:alpha/beta hydrolase fold domain-containing protein [Mucilaginibacter koreensis]